MMMGVNVHPQWIAKMYAAKVGRDHLGLGSVSSDRQDSPVPQGQGAFGVNS